MTTTSMTRSTPMARRVAAASLLGTTIEWYDYFIYGTAAVLVFGPQFFPSNDPMAGTLASLATFAVGFLARPIGGIVMGHLGDKVGRKAMLVLSMMVMGGATVGVGLLPNYSVIGVAAPILLVLLRLLQGFGVGGEWGGAVLMAVEHAPARRRTLFGSFPQMGLPAGVILSNIVFLTMLEIVDRGSFAAWGWRIPFLISAVLIVVGFVLRMKISESPEFLKVRTSGEVESSPIKTVFREHKKSLFLAIGLSFSAPLVGYLVIVYMLSYGSGVLGLPQKTLTLTVAGSAAVWLLMVLVSALLGDRFGKRTVFAFGAALITLWAFPMFMLVDTASPGLVFLALSVACIGLAFVSSPVSALLSALFPPNIRFSGISIGFQLGSILGGAFAPLIATWLFATTGTSFSVAAYMCLAGLASLLVIKLTKEPSDGLKAETSSEGTRQSGVYENS